MSVDAYGSRASSLVALWPRSDPGGRHVQVGLLLDDEGRAGHPDGRVIADELELLGMPGIRRGEYAAMLDDVVAGRLRPAESIGSTIGFDDCGALEAWIDRQPIRHGRRGVLIPRIVSCREQRTTPPTSGILLP